MTVAAAQKVLPGISSRIQATNELIRAASQNDLPVFVTGEPGTEKVLAAKLIHQLSPRALRPMTKINVSWKLPPDLSQYFERCSGGTLIVHLQKEFPIDMQYTLVEIAGHGSFGDPMSGELVESDARVIVLTSHEWKDLVAQTPLLPELKEMLTGQHVEIPPLRNRTEDIPALARYAVRRARETGRSRAQGVEPGVLALFRQWHWPGNAEDLLLVTAQAAIASRGSMVSVDDLPQNFLAQLPEESIEAARRMKSAPGRGIRIHAEEPSSSEEVPVAAVMVPQEPEAEEDFGQPEEIDFPAGDTPTPIPVQARPSVTAGGEAAGGGPARPPRVLTLARRLNAQASLLSRQFSGPLDSATAKAMIDNIIQEATDEQALEALEQELDRGLDLVLALRRQMALLNVRQQQNAETIRDLIQRLTATAQAGGERPEVAEETRQLAESLAAIDRIVRRVADELPNVGQHLEATLLGTIPERRQSTSGIFRKLESQGEPGKA